MCCITAWTVNWRSDTVCMLFHDLLLDRVATHGTRPAMIRGDTVLSYDEAGARVLAAADGLQSAGLQVGERVAVYLNKRPEGVIRLPRC